MQIRRRKRMLVDELDFRIPREDDIFQLRSRECMHANLQKGWWDENQMGKLGGFPLEIPNQFHIGMSRRNGTFEMGCEYIHVVKF